MNRDHNQVKVLLDAWRIIRQYRWRFIVPTFLVMATVLAIGMLVPRKYKAQAIFERRTDLVMTEIMHRGAPESLPNPRKALVEEVTGQPAIDELIEGLQAAGSDDPVPFASGGDFDQLRIELGKKILVHHDIATRELDRISVELVDEDPLLAQKAVNLLVQNYIDRTRVQIEKRLKQTASFFDGEVQHSRKVIDDLENRLLNFEIEHAHLLPDEPGSLQTMLTETHLQAIGLQQEREGVSTLVGTLNEQIDQLPETVPQVTTARNPQLTRLETKRRQLQEQIETRTGIQRMTPKHPELIALHEQIAAIDQQIRDTPAEIVVQKQITSNAKRDALELQLAQAQASVASLTQQQQSLQDQITRLNTQTADLFPVRSSYGKLKREAEQAQRQLAFWEGNLRRVQMALAAEAGNRGVILDFIKPCRPLRRPISPDITHVLAAAFALGLSAGGICVYFAHRSDESFSESDRLTEVVDIPLLGSVSEIISQRQRQTRRVRNLVLYPLNTAVMAAVLAVMTSLLYLDLTKPGLLTQLKQNPTQFLERLVSGPLSHTQPTRE